MFVYIFLSTDSDMKMFGEYGSVIQHWLPTNAYLRIIVKMFFSLRPLNIALNNFLEHKKL